MFILGILLIVASGGFAGLLARYNPGGPAYRPTIIGYVLPTVTVFQAFLAGIVLALIFCLGLWLVVAAGRRRRTLAGRVREAQQEARSATAERDKLAEQLTRRIPARQQRHTPGGTSAPPTGRAPG